MTVSLHGWRAVWQGLGAPVADEALFGELIARYSEKHRHYHTLQHLRDCMRQLDAARNLALRPAEIELALWFHDAYYEPQHQDNEARSADWARQSVRQAGLPGDSGERVHAMVMATRHEAAPHEPDTQLLVDVDLSILGAPPDRFAQSSAQIRAEYAHVSDAQFREGRKRILEGFLQRPRLYSTEHFHAALERQARANLQAEIARL